MLRGRSTKQVRGRSTKQVRDQHGRWTRSLSQPDVAVPTSVQLTGMESLSGLRDRAASMGIDTHGKDDLGVLRAIAEHQVSHGVEGFEEARNDPTLSPEMRPVAAVERLIHRGHSPRAAVAAALTTCFA